METRLKVDEEDLKELQHELKQKGYTLRDINDAIEAEFRNYLYKNHSMTETVYRRLQGLSDSDLKCEEIEYSNGKKNPEKFPDLEKSCNLAELFGIILGDGHIRKRSEWRHDRHISQHYLQFTFHEEELKLRKRTQKLCKIIIGEKASEYPQNDTKAIHLKIHSKELVEKLEVLGLHSGNKTKNQIGIPEWIFEDTVYQKRCLSGLVDTDGCIYTQKHDNRTIIKFSNRSENLKEGFCKICSNLGYTPSKAGKWEVQLAHQEDVKDFINEIEPLKAANLDV